MFATGFASATRAAIVGAALISVSFAGAATASAKELTHDDASFLYALDSAGIVYPTEREAIALGEAICGTFADGFTYREVVSAAAEELTNLDGDDVQVIVLSAAESYCPQYN